jgi:hypothetical protein
MNLVDHDTENLLQEFKKDESRYKSEFLLALENNDKHKI